VPASLLCGHAVVYYPQTKCYYLLLDLGKQELMVDWVRTLLGSIKCARQRLLSAAGTHKRSSVPASPSCCCAPLTAVHSRLLPHTVLEAQRLLDHMLWR
jgi:hypothetical protein